MSPSLTTHQRVYLAIRCLLLQGQQGFCALSYCFNIILCCEKSSIQTTSVHSCDVTSHNYDTTRLRSTEKMEFSSPQNSSSCLLAHQLLPFSHNFLEKEFCFLETCPLVKNGISFKSISIILCMKLNLGILLEAIHKHWWQQGWVHYLLIYSHMGRCLQGVASSRQMCSIIKRIWTSSILQVLTSSLSCCVCVS